MAMKQPPVRMSAAVLCVLDEVCAIKTILFSLLLIGSAPLAAGVAPGDPGLPETKSTADSQIAVDVTAAVETPLDYGAMSHQELTSLGTRWDTLSAEQRMALLREVKLRMAQQKVPDGVLMIRTQRRYGRLVRQSDGSVLRIETRVVQVRPANPTQNPGRRSFGVGFERRTAVAGAENRDASEQRDDAQGSQNEVNADTELPLQSPRTVPSSAPPAVLVNNRKP